MTGELLRRMRRCTRKLRAFHETNERDRRRSHRREKPIVGVWEGEVAAPASSGERIGGGFAVNGAGELPYNEVEEREDRPELYGNHTAPGSNDGAEFPIAATGGTRASRIRDLLQQGIPLYEAFDITGRQANGE
jgi:hypothetical protein